MILNIRVFSCLLSQPTVPCRVIAIVMVTAALLSLAFMGFSGVDGGLRALFGLE